ncbi:DUF488 domain-containing protein [Aquibacillus kalidii]|uniref:DUF488 domain-containing protein n=1 Tax=Aquibacillus kalidii TaxID=2762597 RepID=UPI002E2DF95C|nr:DUF488 family protein [Aquibacillus kalidii]
MKLEIKRVYEPSNEKDGKRILIDRIWPRGISKKQAELDDWLKEVAPSTPLRKWFNHDPEKFDQFENRYVKELETDKDKQESVEKKVKYSKDKRSLHLFIVQRTRFITTLMC